MNHHSIFIRAILTGLLLSSCTGKQTSPELTKELADLNLTRGNITLCGSGKDEFGSVKFSLSCSESVRDKFNLATALLHSFEYREAEKLFASVMDQDPQCILAYWGAAMCNFHPLWEPPNVNDLKKGAKIIELGRSVIQDPTSREAAYLEAIATIYDHWDTVRHSARLQKFKVASEKVFEKYPEDQEAAIFYSLALVASASPADKTFQNQKRAGEILQSIFAQQPNHPGIAHYIIHTFDYPELAELALPTARKYARIAPASAHAQHMPSHIFIRLGLWSEAAESNLQSVSAAQCYAESLGNKGHWDEELHGLDYVVYAYLQQAEDSKALEQLEYMKTITEVFPQDFKVAYAFAAIPARYAVERQDWKAAAALELSLPDFPWDNFLWEKSNVNFARLLGAIHLNRLEEARHELKNLQEIHKQLTDAKETYKANLVLIQIKASEGWILAAEGKHTEAVKPMKEAAAMEDATEKHPVTPGPIIPARELLGDLYLQMGDFVNAFQAYEASLKHNPNRFNGLYGAGQSLEKSGNIKKAVPYYQLLDSISHSSASNRPRLLHARAVIKNSL